MDELEPLLLRGKYETFQDFLMLYYSLRIWTPFSSRNEIFEIGKNKEISYIYWVFNLAFRCVRHV